MFHVNEAEKGRGTLTVKNGDMVLHVKLVGKNIVNLYRGTAEQAKTDEKNWLVPCVDTVEYADGTTEEVYGFDVSVPAFNEDFDLALLGTKGQWYSHKVNISDLKW